MERRVGRDEEGWDGKIRGVKVGGNGGGKEGVGSGRKLAGRGWIGEEEHQREGG